MNNTQQNLGEKIRKYRKRKGMSQMDLELEIGASPGSISRIENGVVNPSKETIMKISQSLELDTYSAADLFGIEVLDYMPLVELSKKIFTLKEKDEIFQTSLDEFVGMMNYYTGFVTLVKNNRIYACYLANTLASKLSLKLISRSFKTYFVDLNNPKGNLCARSIIEEEIIIGKSLTDFIYPAVDKTFCKLLDSFIKTRSAVVLPLITEGKPIGTIMFSDKTNRDFEPELKVLKEFADHVAIAVSSIHEK